MREFEPVYLLDDCRPLPTSCVAIAEQVGNHAVSLSYVATQAGFYYLVHDADGAIHDNLVEHHKTLDTSPPPPPAHDDCGDARWLNESSFDLVDDLSAARNQFDPGRQGCSGPGGTGRDVVYRVVLLAGSAIDVTMTPVGGWDAELYLVSDCGDPVAGGEPDGEGGQRLVHVAADGGNYYLVCDSYGIGPRPFTLRGNHGGPAVDVPANDGALALEACWPNPFNPRTTLRCSLPAPGEVSLCIFDLAGRRIAQLASGPQDAGPHEAVFDGRDDLGRALPAGTYMCRLEAAGQSRTTKLVLVR